MMMRPSLRTCCLAAMLAVSSAAVQAGSATNQVPSCYAAGKLNIQPLPPQRAFYIVLDETVVLDDGLKRSLWDQVRQQIVPGTEFTIFRFSAFSQGKYLDIVASGA